MELLEIIKKELKLDFSSTKIKIDTLSNVVLPFELTAKEFLRFAKADFKTNDERGNINALSNAKRAVDCQIDTALTLFGINIKDENLVKVDAFLKCLNLKKGDFFKLTLIQALSFAPGMLVSKTRKLRNKLEHDYKKPNRKDVFEALELAELFILSIENKISFISDGFTITDKKNYINEWEYKNSMAIGFDHDKRELSLFFYKDNKEIKNIMLTQNDEVYFAVIKLINNIQEKTDLEDALKVFLKILKHPIPENNVKLEFI